MSGGSPLQRSATILLALLMLHAVVGFYLGNTLQDFIAAGAQPPLLSARPQLLSSSYSPQGNVFESVWTSTYDDWTGRFWDDGLPTNSDIIWEGHDAGDLSPNADTSALACFGTITWISVEEVATILNVSVAEDLTLAKFDVTYAAAWDTYGAPER